MSVGSMSLPSNQSDNSEADSDGLFGKLAGRVRHASLYGLDLRQKKSTRKIYHPISPLALGLAFPGYILTQETGFRKLGKWVN